MPVSTINCIGQVFEFKSPGLFRDTIIDQGVVTTRDTTFLKNNTIYSFYQNDSVIIFFTKPDFVLILKKKVKDYDVDWDKELLALILSQPDTNINFQKLNPSGLQINRIIYVVASLLEKGNCYISSPYSNQQIKKINIVKYLKNNNTGRRFYTEDKVLLLETDDGSF